MSVRLYVSPQVGINNIAANSVRKLCSGNLKYKTFAIKPNKYQVVLLHSVKDYPSFSYISASIAVYGQFVLVCVSAVYRFGRHFVDSIKYICR